MIGRILSWARRIAGLSLLTWAAWWLAEEIATRMLGGAQLIAADADTGELYGFQVSPLTPSQRQAALEREAVLMAADWP